MLNKVFKELYLKIYFSKYFSSLDTINELYAKGDKDQYHLSIEVFYADLLRFPQVYHNAFTTVQSNAEIIDSFSGKEASPINYLYYSQVPLLLKTGHLIAAKTQKS
ncbi:MAG: hypothetical protein ABI415_05810 [Flavitalea sp.]